MIEILFEDEWLLIVNKPAGLPTQSTVDKKRDNLYDLLRKSGQWPYLGLHHRLDVPTSGVVVLTKKKEANKQTQELFSEKSIQKTYFCLCHQIPPWAEKVMENHLKMRKMGSGKSKMISVKSGGDYAETSFLLLEKLNNSSLIQAQPRTGRMHQIRVHLAELRFPILGDALYFRADRKYPRLMLHAGQIEFKHPFTNQQILVKAPWPEDFRTIHQKLSQISEETSKQ